MACFIGLEFERLEGKMFATPQHPPSPPERFGVTRDSKLNKLYCAIKINFQLLREGMGRERVCEARKKEGIID